MKIFIFHIDFGNINRREIFILTRPFFLNGKWVDDHETKKKWDLNPEEFSLVKTIEECDIVLISNTINQIFKKKKQEELFKLNETCVKYNKKAFGYVSGDYGYSFQEFSNIYYFRLGGVKSQLSNKNLGFPASLSDFYEIIFGNSTIIPNEKKATPIIGFCGHASLSILKMSKEKIINIVDNIKRFIVNPSRKDYEPLFASSYNRAKILRFFEKSKLVTTNFIYRNRYRAGIKNDEQAKTTTLEYYNNLYNSDYIVCLRGGGNFSIRLYETLMIGKIPIFINTDCLLPFEDVINWKEYTVFIEWENRKNCAKIVSDFHNNLSNEDFMNLQLKCRKLWKEILSINGIFQIIKNDL